MADVVEIMARGIATADERNGAAPYEHRLTLGKHAKEHLFDEAKEAIRALHDAGLVILPKEPTEAMWLAGAEVADQRPSEIMAIYRAMREESQK